MLLTLTRLITAALFIASAAAFATGAAIEHHATVSDTHQVHHAEVGPHDENPGGSEGASGGERPAPQAAEHSSETLLGINPESTAMVLIAVAVSVVLAALILTVGSPLLAGGVALAMLAFTALDIREVTHQLDESHPGLAALAAAVAALHVLAGAAALLIIRETRTQPGASGTA